METSAIIPARLAKMLVNRKNGAMLLKYVAVFSMKTVVALATCSTVLARICMLQIAVSQLEARSVTERRSSGGK